MYEDIGALGEEVPFLTRRTSYNPTLLDLYDLAKEENSIQLHVPGHNYLGPGTHVISNILNQVKPVDITDAIALQHDVNYVGSTTLQDIINADEQMISTINSHYLDGDVKTTEDLIAVKALQLKNFLKSNYGINSGMTSQQYELLRDLSNTLLETSGFDFLNITS